jgi:uncharacterized membrane protein
MSSSESAPEAAPALWLQLLTLLIAVVGLADSIYITIQEETGSPLAGCSEKAGMIDCGAVLNSPESIILGIPVAVFGIVFFSFMVAMMSPWAWRSPWREIWQLRLVSLVVGMGFVIYLIYAEFYEIGHICLYCTSVHILTFVLFTLTVIAAAVWNGPPQSWRARQGAVRLLATMARDHHSRGAGPTRSVPVAVHGGTPPVPAQPPGICRAHSR